MRARRGEAVRTFYELLNTNTDECLPWPFSIQTAGYGQVGIGGRKIECVHVLACEHRHGPKPTPDHQAAHARADGSACVSRTCMNPRHLSWKSRAENAADATIHGTQTRGHMLSKLTEDDVHQIRARRAAGERTALIAADFDVNPKTINDIHRRDRWGWLPDREAEVHALNVPAALERAS